MRSLPPVNQAADRRAHHPPGPSLSLLTAPFLLALLAAGGRSVLVADAAFSPACQGRFGGLPPPSSRRRGTENRRSPALGVSSSSSAVGPPGMKVKEAAAAGGKGSTAAEDDDDYREGDDDALLSSMPWSDFQSWALRDNLPKYVVAIPSPGGSGGGSDSTHALWRTMVRDVTELAGYDVEYLRRRHDKILLDGPAAGHDGDDDAAVLKSTPLSLPLLDDFEFTPDGSVSGLSYGVPGIADGSPIRTASVADVARTVPLGYVRTEDGAVAFELGMPKGSTIATRDGRRTMLEGIARTASAVVLAGADGAARAVERGSAGSVDAYGSGLDGNLVNLAGLTAVTLAGATAVGMMSHHLTVNVFWV